MGRIIWIKSREIEILSSPSRDGCDDTATEAALISIEVGKVQLNCTETELNLENQKYELFFGS